MEAGRDTNRVGYISKPGCRGREANRGMEMKFKGLGYKKAMTGRGIDNQSG